MKKKRLGTFGGKQTLQTVPSEFYVSDLHQKNQKPNEKATCKKIDPKERGLEGIQNHFWFEF